jgi:hypothetical protein
MAEERMEVSREGLARLQSAAADFAHAEIARIVTSVLEDLQSRPTVGVFGDVAARHLWDEYCWALQEGPFDDDMGWDDIRFGSLSDGFDDLVRASIQTEVEKLPQHALVFLSLQAFEEDADSDEAESIGNIWVDGVVSLVLEEVNARASRRNLDLIGPHQADAIGYEIEGTGMVWSILSDRGEAIDIIAGHSDALLDPKGDLSELAAEMVEAFMTAAAEDDEGAVFSEFLACFADKVRALLRENDVMPSLEGVTD